MQITPLTPIAAARIIHGQLRRGRTIFICGNGGSAAMASHFAAELMVRYVKNRPPIPCISLTADQAVITACANDFGYEYVFSRQIDALGRAGDVLIALTTSGQSDNVHRAVAMAERKAMDVLAPLSRQDTETTAQCQERHLGWLHRLTVDLESLLHPGLNEESPP